MEASGNVEVDIEAHPTAKKLVDRCKDFFAEVDNLTPGKALEEKLNLTHGPGTPLYDDISKYVRIGLSEGWLASTEISGPNYRRSKICLPSAETRYFSITSVYMKSDDEEVLSGQYHVHPYGEINCVVQVGEGEGEGGGAQLMGMQGWQGAGWTSPGPGTHHFPQVRRGALVALFFLPAGRIAYDAEPGMPQPLSV
ncbi:p-hydroxylaminobenzoate lyase [Rhexocercosporidium sp. MPI-PUGE-AT-0058]|nr:p-hydroxylaminobenzoate lyase [Rhexocercosporidium sp. MPI-PUGE-AT-0058]